MKNKILLVVLFGLLVVFADAKVRLPQVFADNMVLQRGMKVPVWGWADPGENVSVELEGISAETVACPDGKWKLFLGPLEAGGPFSMTVKGKNSITLNNVLVGEVWVCSGQSNMALEVKSCQNARDEISEANYPQIRLIQVKSAKASRPLDDVSPVEGNQPRWLNRWQVCSPNTVADFTGVGYFFGLQLWKKLGVPIGLISASWGGTTAEAWTPKDTLENNPELKSILKNWPEYNNDEEWLKAEYKSFVEDVEKAQREGDPEPLYFNQPAVLYNGIIAPIVPFGIRGVIWYQGESNAYRAYQYRDLFPVLIQKWRKNWGQGEFPFLFVQLANYKFEPQVFPELREAQSMALSLPNTAMVVTIDIGDSTTIHPKNKQEVGRRLFLAAEKLAYGENLICSGPVYRSMSVVNDKCILTFRQLGEEIMVKDGGALAGFEIAGSDRKFVKAKAEISGNDVVVWSEEIVNPVAVRYAWSNSPSRINFYNKDNGHMGLPASPFRTDDWPGITSGRK